METFIHVSVAASREAYAFLPPLLQHWEYVLPETPKCPLIDSLRVSKKG